MRLGWVRAPVASGVVVSAADGPLGPVPEDAVVFGADDPDWEPCGWCGAQPGEPCAPGCLSEDLVGPPVREPAGDELPPPAGAGGSSGPPPGPAGPAGGEGGDGSGA